MNNKVSRLGIMEFCWLVSLAFLLSFSGCKAGKLEGVKIKEWTLCKAADGGEYYLCRDVIYRSEPTPKKQDIYLPVAGFEEHRSLPCIVNIHGGGWHEGSKEKNIAVKCAEMLATNGYVVFTINYELNSEGHIAWPQNLYDCKAAVNFIRDNAARYGVDPSRLGVVGNSAGGHLALLTALTLDNKALNAGADNKCRDSVACVVDFYGITDVRLWGQGSFVSPDATNAAEVLELASPVTHVGVNTPPVMLLHGDKDDIVPISQSEILADKLYENGVEYEFVIVSEGHHGFTPYPDCLNGNRDMREIILRFLDKYLGERM